MITRRRKRVKYAPSLWHAGLSYLIEMDRRLSGRGLVLSEFAADCEISRSTAARYLSLIAVRIGLPVSCRFCVTGVVMDAVDALDVRGRGRRVYRYSEDVRLFTKDAQKAVAVQFKH